MNRFKITSVYYLKQNDFKPDMLIGYIDADTKISSLIADMAAKKFDGNNCDFNVAMETKSGWVNHWDGDGTGFVWRDGKCTFDPSHVLNAIPSQ